MMRVSDTLLVSDILPPLPPQITALAAHLDQPLAQLVPEDP